LTLPVKKDVIKEVIILTFLIVREKETGFELLSPSSGMVGSL